MCRVACLLVVLAGNCVGLQFPLSYQYRYTGLVATGLPDVGPQHAAAYIETSVSVDTISGSYAIVQFQQTRVWQQQGELRCGGAGPDGGREDAHWQPLSPTIRAAFQQPFKVNFRSSMQPVMEVPVDEPVWMTNVRRAVVGLLRAVPSVDHLLTRAFTDTTTNSFVRSNGRVTPLEAKTFSIREDTIHGSCLVQYTVTPAPASERDRLPRLRKDIQRREGKSQDGAWPMISDHLHVILRSPDLTDCSDRPVLVYNTGGSNGQSSREGSAGEEAHGANDEELYFSRIGGQLLRQSSLGRFLIRGENNPRHVGGLRLERALIEGGSEMRPLGATNAALSVITNQSLELEYATYRQHKPREPTALRRISSLKFEVISPFARAQRHADWIRYGNEEDSPQPVHPAYYLTGYSDNSSSIDTLKSRLHQEICEAATILQTAIARHSAGGAKAHHNVPSGATIAPEVAEHLASVADIIKALPRHALQEVLLRITEKDELYKQLFLETLSASGSPAAVDLILTEVGSGRLSTASSYAVLSTLGSCLHSPATVTLLFSFVKTLSGLTSEASPGDLPTHKALLHMTVLLTSTAFHTVCQPQNELYYGDLYGKACHLEKEFLQFIQHQVQSSSSSPCDRAALVHAAGFLPSATSFSYVAGLAAAAGDAAAGDVGRRSIVRTAAMFGMLRGHTPDLFRDQVLSSLQPVLVSQVEPPEIRQVALLVMLTWEPEEAWWLQLARASWQEQSTVVAELVYTVIKTISELEGPSWKLQSAFASRALPLVRPVLAPSHSSFLKIVEAIVQPPVMEAETRLGWVLNMKTLLPQEFLLALTARLSGVRLPLLEALFLGDDIRSFWERLRDLGSELQPQHHQQHQHQQQHQKQQHQQHRGPMAEARLKREFGNILHALGSRTSGSPSAEGLLLLRLFSSMHHVLPVDLTWLKTAIAPLWRPGYSAQTPVHFVKYWSPIERKVVLPSDMGLPVTTHIQTPSFIYQSGSYKMSSSTKQTERSEQVSGTAVHVSYDGNTTACASIQSSVEVQVPWLHTILAAGVQLRAAVALRNATVGVQLRSAGQSTSAELYLQAAFDDKVSVTSVSCEPYTSTRPLQPGPDQPGGRQQHTFREERQEDQTRKKRTYHFSTTSSGVGGRVVYEGHDSHHVLPGSPWQLLYPGLSRDRGSTPLHHHVTSLYLDTAGAVRHLELTLSHASATKSHEKKHQEFVDLTLSDSAQTRLQKLSQFTGPGGFMASVTASSSLPGSSTAPHRYEVAFLASAPTAGDPSGREKRRYQVTVIGTGGGTVAPAGDTKVCLHASVLTPKLPPLDRLDKLLETPLRAEVTGALLAGTTCEQQAQVAKLQAHLSVSASQLQRLARDLPAQCNFNRLDPSTSLKRTAFYDSIQLDLDWQQGIPDVLLNTSYKVSGALRSLAFPYVSSNCLHVNAPQRRLLLNVTRLLETKRATGWLSRPGCLDYMEDLPVPDMLDMLLPLHGRHAMRSGSPGYKRQRNAPAVVPPGDQCYVLPNRVVTFDGVSYELLPTACYRAVFKYIDETENLLILTRDVPDTPHQEYRIMMPDASLDIELLGIHVKINGQELHTDEEHVMDSSDHVVAIIRKAEEATEINLPSRLQLFIKGGSKLVLRVEAARYRGSVEGLCGNFDGSSIEDLTDPRGCVYSRSEGPIFGASWTVQPCNTSDEHLMLAKRRHQWTCPLTVAQLGLPVTDTYDPDSCAHEVHRVLKGKGEEEGQLCVTTLPVKTCESECEPLPGMEREVMFEVKCWPVSEAPLTVQGASQQEEGFLYTSVPEAGDVRPALLVYPMECAPKRH